MPEIASFKEFARILGVKRTSYVSQLKSEGRLVLTDDGKRVRVAESLARLEAHRDPSKAHVAARHAAARASANPAQGEGAGEPAAAGEPASDENLAAISPSYADARAKREHYQALESKRAYEVAIGKLMDAGEVASAVSAATTTLRTRLESLPDVLAPQVIGIADEARARALIAESIEHALDEASRHFAELARAAA